MIEIDQPRRAQTAVVAAATFGAAALLGLVLAYWTWMWLAPRALPSPTMELGEAVNAEGAAANVLFGNPPQGAAASGLAIRLFGVAASAGRGGYALLQPEGRPVSSVREGQEVMPGVRLAEVHGDHVVLDRGGMRENLPLPKKNSAPAAAALPVMVAPAQPALPSNTPAQANRP